MRGLQPGSPRPQSDLPFRNSLLQRSLPMLSSCPSGSMTFVTRPTGCPVLDIPVMVTVTSSPALNDFAVMPKLIRVEGAFHSPSQCTKLPFSSLASNFRKVCGLVQTQAVTVPFTVTVLLSYAAFP